MAVVGHGVWIEMCLMHYCPEVLDMGRRRVHNCEVYRLTLVSDWEESVKGHGRLRPVSINMVNAQLLDNREI